MEWSIKKNRVIEEVEKVVAYIAAKRDNGQEFEKLNIVEENEEILNSWWEEAKVLLCTRLRRFFNGAQEKELVYTVDLKLTEDFEEKLKEGIGTAIERFFVMFIAAKWLQLTGTEEAQNYAVEAGTMLENVKELVEYKKSRTKRRLKPF